MPVPIDTEAANSTTPSSLNPPAGATGDITNGTTEPPKTPSDLPPAALDLAAKLFDLARNGETDTLKAYMDAGPFRTRVLRPRQQRFLLTEETRSPNKPYQPLRRQPPHARVLPRPPCHCHNAPLEARRPKCHERPWPSTGRWSSV